MGSSRFHVLPRAVSIAAVALVMLIAAACGRSALPEPPASAAAAELAQHRASLAAFADRLGSASPQLGVDGFAQFMQHTLDRTAERLSPDASRDAIARAFLDDVVDLALGGEHPRIQRWLMVSPPLWRGDPVVEAQFGRAGFGPAFVPGEGRIRHFALAAAGSWALPPLWVEVGARWVGRDFLPHAGTDGAADVAANAAGRAFAAWLRQTDAATLRDGVSVARWIRDRFGEAVP